jgi:hypothetical protein
MLNIRALGVTALLLVACRKAISLKPAVIELDFSKPQQAVIGWKATAEIGHTEFPYEFHSWKDTVINLAVDDLGIDRARLQIQAGAENPISYFAQFLRGQISRKEWRLLV